MGEKTINVAQVQTHLKRDWKGGEGGHQHSSVKGGNRDFGKRKNKTTD